MLSNHLISGCVGALAIGLSSIGAMAAPAVLHSTALSAATDRSPIVQVRGGGGGISGGGFHAGDGIQGGGLKGDTFTSHADGLGYGLHGGHKADYLDAPYYDGGTCYYSSRRGHTICGSF